MTTIARAQIPSSIEQEQASAAFDVLDRVINDARESELFKFRMESEAESIPLPRHVAELLAQILYQTARGKAVTVVPANAEVTTQQAAEFLNVSRPFVTKLIDNGELPARLVGTHRRIQFEDLVRYKRIDDQKRKEAMQALVEMTQELGLEE